MDAELTRRLGALASAELAIIMDFMQSGHRDRDKLVNEELTFNSDLTDVASKTAQNS